MNRVLDVLLLLLLSLSCAKFRSNDLKRGELIFLFLFLQPSFSSENIRRTNRVHVDSPIDLKCI